MFEKKEKIRLSQGNASQWFLIRSPPLEIFKYGMLPNMYVPISFGPTVPKERLYNPFCASVRIILWRSQKAEGRGKFLRPRQNIFPVRTGLNG